MEKIVDVSALTDQLKILLWDRSKSREELAELVIGLIEDAGEEIVRCKDCGHYENEECCCPYLWMSDGAHLWPSADDFCVYGERRDNDD